jgi:hypothetical protein
MKTIALLQGALVLFTCLLLFADASAQCPANCPKTKKKSRQLDFRQFKEFQVDAKIGAGLLPTFFMDGGEVHIPPVTAGVDVFIARNFFVGITAGMTEQEVQRDYQPQQITVAWKNRFYHAGLRVAAAYTAREDWNLYGGFAVGMNFSRLTSRKENETSSTAFTELKQLIGFKPNRNDFSYSGFLGAQYAPTPKFSLWAEIGQSISLITLGAGYRLH